MAEVVLENVANQIDREVVQWQAGDHEVVRRIGLKLLQRLHVDFGESGDSIPDGLSLESPSQMVGERLVQFDEVEAVAVLQLFDDCVREGAGPGADFEHSDRLVGLSLSQVTRHCSRQKPAARRDCSGRLEPLSKLAEEGELFSEHVRRGKDEERSAVAGLAGLDPPYEKSAERSAAAATDCWTISSPTRLLHAVLSSPQIGPGVPEPTGWSSNLVIGRTQ